MIHDTRKVALHAAVLAAALTTLTAAPAHAYIDPGSGSYVFQLALGALVGVAYAVKTSWRRLRPRLDSLRFWRRK